jgi:hypothetical protein
MHLTRDEWLRLAGFYGFIVALHVAGWGLYLDYPVAYPALLGFEFVAGLEFDTSGCVIVGVFPAGWVQSVVLWKFTRPGERPAAQVHMHEHVHDGGRAHSHRHFHWQAVELSRASFRGAQRRGTCFVATH